jgi:predicted nucleic acid-binding protein
LTDTTLPAIGTTGETSRFDRLWLLDTNVTAEIISAGGSAHVKAWAAARDEATFCLSVLTIAEFDKGIANLPDGDPRRRVYMTTRDSLAARFGARLLPVSDAMVRRWGSISGTVRRDTGHPPPVIDTLLAATALDHDLYLATRNVRDVRHCGAAVFNPWEDDPSAFPVIPKQRRRHPPRA